jgi:hypothetical protein
MANTQTDKKGGKGKEESKKAGKNTGDATEKVVVVKR